MNKRTTKTISNMNGKASRLLEKLDATYNGDHTYDVHVWNFETNRCEHFKVIANSSHTYMTFPKRIATLYNQPAMKKWMGR
jgi:hypothetical protein